MGLHDNCTTTRHGVFLLGVFWPLVADMWQFIYTHLTAKLMAGTTTGSPGDCWPLPMTETSATLFFTQNSGR